MGGQAEPGRDQRGPRLRLSQPKHAENGEAPGYGKGWPEPLAPRAREHPVQALHRRPEDSPQPQGDDDGNADDDREAEVEHGVTGVVGRRRRDMVTRARAVISRGGVCGGDRRRVAVSAVAT